jgi:hypothetical protein
MLHTRRDDIGLVEKKFKTHSLVCEGAESSRDQKVEPAPDDALDQ